MDLPEQLTGQPTAESLDTGDSGLTTLQMFHISGGIAGSVAHDFNNILTGILGNLELMQRRATRLGITEFNDYLAGARSAAARGVAFSQSLLAIAGHQALEMKSIPTAEFLTNVEDLLRASFGNTVKIAATQAPVLVNIVCDETKLEDALLHLAQNASQSEGITSLQISAETVRIDGDGSSLYLIQPGDYVAISLHDDGAGMSELVAAHAFDPFFSTKGAAGIGLSKILGFARQSGGHAFIATHMPGNTKISILLPAKS